MDRSLQKKKPAKIRKKRERKRLWIRPTIESRNEIRSRARAAIYHRSSGRGGGLRGCCIAPSELANYWNKTFWPRANVESSLIESRGAVSSCWFDDRVPRNPPTRLDSDKRSEDSSNEAAAKVSRREGTRPPSTINLSVVSDAMALLLPRNCNDTFSVENRCASVGRVIGRWYTVLGF